MSNVKIGGIRFEVTSFPECPSDFALFGAREWLATEKVPVEGMQLSYAELYPDSMADLQRLVELAGLTLVDVLDMVARGHLYIYYTRDK